MVWQIFNFDSISFFKVSFELRCNCKTKKRWKSKEEIKGKSGCPRKIIYFVKCIFQFVKILK